MGPANRAAEAGAQARAEAGREEGEHVVSYDPTQPTPLDVIRGYARDTSNDPATEILQDAEYTAILTRHGVTVETDTAGFYRAAAEALRQVAVTIEQQPTSVAATSDGSVGWSANRTTSLRAMADWLDGKADKIEADEAGGFWGPVVTVKGDFLTGTEAETW